MDALTMRAIIADLRDENIQVLPGTPETALRKTRRLVAHALQIILDAEDEKPAEADVLTISRIEYEKLKANVGVIAGAFYRQSVLESAPPELRAMYVLANNSYTIIEKMDKKDQEEIYNL